MMGTLTRLTFHLRKPKTDMLRRTLLTFAVLLSPVLLNAQAQNADWHKAFPAFRIAGNLYYVGTADLAIFVIHTLQGDILINTNSPEDAPALKKSMQQVGLKYSDITYLLTSHAHSEHDSALREIKKETGATVMVMQDDASDVESIAPGRPGIHVDRVLRDGYTVELAGVKLIAHHTPGHTKGCTTWTLRVLENNTVMNVVIVGGATVEAGTLLVNNKRYPTIAPDYLKTFSILKTLPCDIFLGAHGEYFGLKDKYARLKAGNANAFVDPNGFKTWLATKEQEFLTEWDRQKKSPGSPKK